MGPIALESLRSDLVVAEDEHRKATDARVRAQEKEAQWFTEVDSLKNLIKVREKRLGVVVSPGETPPVAGGPREQQPGISKRPVGTESGRC